MPDCVDVGAVEREADNRGFKEEFFSRANRSRWRPFLSSFLLLKMGHRPVPGIAMLPPARENSPTLTDYGIHRAGFQEYLLRGYTNGDTCHGREKHLTTRDAQKT